MCIRDSNIEVDVVKDLGGDKLSSMMGAVEGDQITDLQEEKKVSIIETLDANFFDADSADYKAIMESVPESERPAIAEDKLGKTKLNEAENLSSVFGGSLF